jgi:hypothetical protein
MQPESSFSYSQQLEENINVVDVWKYKHIYTCPFEAETRINNT